MNRWIDGKCKYSNEYQSISNFTAMNLQHSIIKFQYLIYQSKWISQWGLDLTNKLDILSTTPVQQKSVCYKNKYLWQDSGGISPASTRNLSHYWVGGNIYLACAYCMSYSLKACTGILWTAAQSCISVTCVSRIVYTTCTQGVPFRCRDKISPISQTTFFNQFSCLEIVVFLLKFHRI